MASRYIDNEIRDFSLLPKKERKGSKARKAIAVEDAILHSALRLSLQRIIREMPPSDAAKSRDFSVYTGTAGYCLLFMVLHSRGIGFGVAGRTGQLAGFASPLELATSYLDAAQASLERQEAKRGTGTQGFTFLTGAAGVHAVGAAVAQRAGDMARCRHHAREVAAMEELALAEDEPRSHDVLNGLAGYLSALLFVRANTREEVGEQEVPDPLILRVVERIVSDGADAPSEGRWSSPNSPSRTLGGEDEEGGGEEGSGDGVGADTSPGGGGSGSMGGAGSQSGGDAARPADQWGEVDPDAGEWEDPNNSRRGSSSASERSKGKRGSPCRGGGRGAAAVAEAAAVAAAAAAAAAAEASEGYGGVLTYEWHGKMYLGAARGVSGILFVLMQALQTVYGASLLVEARGGDGTGRADLPPQAAEQLYLIRSTVDAVLATALPEGNFPSRPVSADDRLVQWCHGASGVIPMLTKAHEVFEDDRYLEMARRSADVVWKRGLLTKGNGICHGVAGNAYAFLALRKADGDDGRHLHRARSFAGFAASAVLGPNPSAGANAFRGDPFGPGAHAHPRGFGGGGGMSRSSSHDAGKSLPAFGWPSSSSHGKSASTVNSAVATAAAVSVGNGGGVSGVAAGSGGGSASGGGRAGGGRSNSIGSAGTARQELPSQALPDRPMSLFEGLAGAAAFLADMVPEAGAGENAWFPSLELDP